MVPPEQASDARPKRYRGLFALGLLGALGLFALVLQGECNYVRLMGELRASEHADLDAAEADLRLAASLHGLCIGSDGRPTPWVQGYRALLEADDGVIRFRRLLKTAYLPGQLYALCGLSILRLPAFEQELSRLWEESPERTVEIGWYDSTRTVSLREVLGAPAPHTAEKVNEHGLLDIASGAPCRMLAGERKPGEPPLLEGHDRSMVIPFPGIGRRRRGVSAGGAGRRSRGRGASVVPGRPRRDLRH